MGALPLQSRQRPPRHVGIDGHAAIKRDVPQDARMTVDACDPLGVSGCVRIEFQRDAAHVEREA